MKLKREIYSTANVLLTNYLKMTEGYLKVINKLSKIEKKQKNNLDKINNQFENHE